MAAAQHLIDGGGGSIILTSSSAGLKGQPFLTATSRRSTASSASCARSRPDVQATEPIDQSNGVLFLARDESRYITSTTFTVDAGITQH